MSKEFNYKRAWQQFVMPELFKLPKYVLDTLRATRKEVDNIHQVGSTSTVIGHSKELLANMFDEIPTNILAWAAEVVFYYGHISPNKSCQSAGLYWKFKDLASMSMIARKPYDGETIHKAQIKMEDALEKFFDHKEGTSYDNDEVIEYLRSIAPKLEDGPIEMYKVDNVNHKPDVFCIGPKHFPKDGDMYIKPEQAPCCSCGRNYSEHTYDTVMFLKPVLKEGEDPDTFLKSKHLAIKAKLECVIDLVKASGIKLDGFAFVKP